MSIRKEAAKLALRFARWCNPTVELDGISHGDVATRDAFRAGWFRTETCELADGFPIAPSDTVIDVGCGQGMCTGFCAHFAAQIIAVDIDPQNIATIEQRLRLAGATNYRTIISDGNPLPIEAATADKVICTEVLEHVDDPSQFMRELVRIGKPGALYFLSVPDPLSEQVLKCVSPPEAFRKPHHVRVIGRDEFECMVTHAGLQVEKHAFYGFYWAVRTAMLWQCNVDFNHGRHPALDYWAHAWNAVLDLPEGQQCKNALDEAMPKSQVIIARK